MKSNKLCVTLTLCLCLLGCLDENDGPVGILPFSPTNLKAITISSFQINLSWTDNSTNEVGFKVERRTANSIYAIIATVSSDVGLYIDKELLPNTVYIYRVYSFNNAGNSTSYSNEITNTTFSILSIPILTTTNVTNITNTMATSGGTILNNGGSDIISKGVVWSSSANPTVDLLTKTSEGSGFDSFVSVIKNLNPNTIYHLRSYATNNTGTGYGDDLIFMTSNSLADSSHLNINLSYGQIKDISGNNYPTIIIAGKEWMAENLRTCQYSNGDSIPNVTFILEWGGLRKGAWAHYANNSNFERPYGKLYNWYAAVDIRNICPSGWHVPSNSEWNNLKAFLGNATEAGGKMKSIGTIESNTGLWRDPNKNASNSSGFSGLPAGYRFTDGEFKDLGKLAYMWSSTERNTNEAWFGILPHDKDYFGLDDYNKSMGVSIRCIKD